MPEVATTVFVTIRGGETMPLQPCDKSQPLSYITTVRAIVFTRQTATGASAPVTVSLVAHCGTAEKSGTRTFTIASHAFASSAGGKTVEEEEAVVFPLRSPIVFTSQGPVHSLEVQCSEWKRDSHANDRSDSSSLKPGDSGAVYTVTLHGSQRTFLTKEQVLLLCNVGGETSPQ
ncbi:hypothetical protein DQ04_01311030 [Trypanosoma grayi]|uniref:hypothetical protein n=1 Tax=Trypanosoma grayi TaxID=71804 RepID=UPI0004F436BD|nr:hypothetical protein DQ04_01311030 [Trypanosoma grayi]KEG12944.1 hypothetical protein DQ04_01311030 [Trypanosoma grayi]